MSPPGAVPRVSDRTYLALAVLAWLVTYAVVGALVCTTTAYNTITYDVYVAAAQRWWAHAPLYDLSSVDDFQYLPHAALLFSPFAYLGTPLGELLWRGCCWALFAHGVWRVARHLAPTAPGKAFFLATALTIAPSVNSLGIGQSNLLLAAATLHVAADLVERRFWRATGLLMLGLAAKPLMAVLLLLVGALYRPTRWRIPLALGVLFALPCLASDPAYVLEQYRGFLAKSRLTANPHRLFEDANGLLTSAGVVLPYTSLVAVRALAAVGTLALCARAKRAFPDARAALYVAALAVAYLMLFNPRTQSNSYSIAAPLVGLLAAGYLLEQRWAAAGALVAVTLCWAGNTHWMVWPEFWLKPLACAGFAALLAWDLFRAPLSPSPTKRRSAATRPRAR